MRVRRGRNELNTIQEGAAMTNMQLIDRKITLKKQAIDGLTNEIVKQCAEVAKLEAQREAMLKEGKK